MARDRKALAALMKVDITDRPDALISEGTKAFLQIMEAGIASP
jgi:hypothetical protein